MTNYQIITAYYTFYLYIFRKESTAIINYNCIVIILCQTNIILKQIAFSTVFSDAP